MTRWLVRAEKHVVFAIFWIIILFVGKAISGDLLRLSQKDRRIHVCGQTDQISMSALRNDHRKKLQNALSLRQGRAASAACGRDKTTEYPGRRERAVELRQCFDRSAQNTSVKIVWCEQRDYLRGRRWCKPIEGLPLRRPLFLLSKTVWDSV